MVAWQSPFLVWLGGSEVRLIPCSVLAWFPPQARLSLIDQASGEAHTGTEAYLDCYLLCHQPQQRLTHVAFLLVSLRACKWGLGKSAPQASLQFSSTSLFLCYQRLVPIYSCQAQQSLFLLAGNAFQNII